MKINKTVTEAAAATPRQAYALIRPARPGLTNVRF